MIMSLSYHLRVYTYSIPRSVEIVQRFTQQVWRSLPKLSFPIRGVGQGWKSVRALL